MRIKFNPRYKLTPEQGRELWQCWEPIRMLVEPSKTTLVAMQLSRQCPSLSRRQLYMICATLANLGQMNIPDWAHEILDTKQQETK
jgi:hypothetical protein